MSDRLVLFPLSCEEMGTLMALWQREGGREWMGSRRDTSQLDVPGAGLGSYGVQHQGLGKA